MPASVTESVDPRYPIGRFDRRAVAGAALRAPSIEALHLLPSRLQAAVSGLTEIQLETPYRDGGWTVRQVVHHVADSHMNAYLRTKFALTEDKPTIKPYDEARWAELADARTADVTTSLALLRALHQRWVALLASLTEAQWARSYVHPAMGEQSLDEVAALYSWHSRHHTAHVTALRARMQW